MDNFMGVLNIHAYFMGKMPSSDISMLGINLEAYSRR